MTADSKPADACPARSHRTRADVSAAKAELPEELWRLAEKVACRTRLWRGERRDVFCELCAHFRDGLAAERPAEQLIRDFGDPKVAARLIRRAKKRCRPLIWRIWRRGLQATGLLLLLLITHMAWMAFVSRPTICVDHVVKLNKPILAIPREQRAWLLYRQVLAELPKGPEDWRDLGPGKPEWTEAVAWLEANGHFVRCIRQAALMPTLGVTYTTEWDFPAPDKLSGDKWLKVGDGPGQAGPLISVLLPHCGRLRDFGHILRADALRAAAHGDRSTAIEDIVGIAGMGRQLNGGAFLIEQLVGSSLAHLAADTALRVLSVEGGEWTRQELIRLAHGLAGQFPDGVGRLDLSGERFFSQDIIQRVYTDSALGGGRLIAREFLPYGFVGGGKSPTPLGQRFAHQALASVLAAGRAATEREWSRIWQEIHEECRRSLCDPRFGQWEDEFADRRSHRWYIIRYPVIVLMTPSLLRAALLTHGTDAALDAAQTVIAVHAYRLAHGEYPARLKDLVPVFLPRMAIDPWDGQPLKYRPAAPGEQIQVMRQQRPTKVVELTADDGFVLYSIGGDQQDDGGRVHQVQAWSGCPGDSEWANRRGDHIYWPPVEP